MPGRKEWRLIDNGSNEFDVEYGRTTLRTDLSYMNAKKYIRDRLKNGEKVFLVEEDGYRTNITKEFSQRGRAKTEESA